MHIILDVDSDHRAGELHLIMMPQHDRQSPSCHISSIEVSCRLLGSHICVTLLIRFSASKALHTAGSVSTRATLGAAYTAAVGLGSHYWCPCSTRKLFHLREVASASGNVQYF